jgi:hypothetical protein
MRNKSLELEGCYATEPRIHVALERVLNADISAYKSNTK